eukprot:jgi/Pico_ML_1/52947/g3580.t1
MMQELCELVALKHNGSLKAEHGTGRNVAPFVEMEWGSKAYELMWELKELFDPDYVLNPGVILNHDEDVHRKALKPSPPAHEIIDRTADDDARLKEFEEIYVYQEALVKASENGKYPIVMDTSPCLKTLKENLTANELKFSLMEPVEFISRFLVDKLDFAKKKQSVTIHVPCSSKKMGMESQMMYIASKCAEQHLEVPQGCKDGYSTSRTCLNEWMPAAQTRHLFVIF